MCSVEISMYPLENKYKNQIICFIKKLRNHKKIKVISNGMSTQIFGDYDNVINIVNKEIKFAFKNKNKIIFNLKIVNSDLSIIEDF
tara:strand:- start:210 stop:467 length:258 start_codon:yes stop_codon:yes gene_type:complete